LIAPGLRIIITGRISPSRMYVRKQSSPKQEGDHQVNGLVIWKIIIIIALLCSRIERRELSLDTSRETCSNLAWSGILASTCGRGSSTLLVKASSYDDVISNDGAINRGEDILSLF